MLQDSAILTGCPVTVFSANFTIGTSKVELLVDTGSTTLAVASNACINCDTISRYTPGDTAVNLNAPIAGSYLDGSGWSGSTYRDIVAMGSLSITLTFATIEASLGGFFYPTPCLAFTPTSAPNYDGIIGLAYESVALGQTQSFFDQLRSHGHLDKGIMSMQFCVFTGQLTMGGLNASVVNDTKIFWTPIVQQTYYVVRLQALVMNGYAGWYAAGSNVGAIIDSGTSGMLLPSAMIVWINYVLSNNAAWVSVFGPSYWTDGVCRTVDGGEGTIRRLSPQLPPMYVQLDGVTVPISVINGLVIPIVTGSGTTYWCPGVFESDFIVLGWGFMNQYVTIFDIDNSRVGFYSPIGTACSNNLTLIANSAMPASKQTSISLLFCAVLFVYIAFCF